MTSIEDRRSPVAVRVSHTALVDICSQTGRGSPFQAESSNISGRGMRVRTSFLPEIGEDLVCRFNHGEQEVLVEGVVAWRAEGQDSGEFGIQFTALDADSAEVLTNLGETMSFSPGVPSVAAPDIDAEEEEFLAAGARVRLHIDGLGAPMKACVHDGTARKIRVGSSLEFLKLGRPLELESVCEGERRGAHVESVNVVMNPSTRIPELVVQLRYEGVSPTPAPATTAARPLSDSRRAVDEAEEDEVSTFGEDEPESWEPAAEALRARLVSAMSGAGAAARKAGGVLSSLASSTGATIKKESTVRRARSRTQSGRPQATSQRRLQTHRLSQPAPTHLRSGIHDLGMASKREQPRASTKRRALDHEAVPKRKLPAGLIFGVAFLVFAGSAVGLRGLTQGSAPPTSSAQVETRERVEQEAITAATAADEAAPDPASEPEGVVAEVPLFGPQAMAVKAAEQKPNEEGLAEAEKRAAAASVDDQSWDESEPDLKSSEGKPWGRGRLYLPTVHRIRLDGAGTALAGAMNSDGFTVVVPGRKAMESGKAIEKRDKRIVSVLTNNNARGATIKFEFRGPVPPYRARLRQDFVEFLVSAPEDTVGRL